MVLGSMPSFVCSDDVSGVAGGRGQAFWAQLGCHVHQHCRREWQVRSEGDSSRRISDGVHRKHDLWELFFYFSFLDIGSRAEMNTIFSCSNSRMLNERIVEYLIKLLWLIVSLLHRLDSLGVGVHVL